MPHSRCPEHDEIKPFIHQRPADISHPLTNHLSPLDDDDDDYDESQSIFRRHRHLFPPSSSTTTKTSSSRSPRMLCRRRRRKRRRRRRRRRRLRNQQENSHLSQQKQTTNQHQQKYQKIQIQNGLSLLRRNSLLLPTIPVVHQYQYQYQYQYTNTRQIRPPPTHHRRCLPPSLLGRISRPHAFETMSPRL